MATSINLLAAGAAAPAVAKAPVAIPGIIARAQTAVITALKALASFFGRSAGAVAGLAKAHPLMATGAAVLTVGAFLKYCPRGQAICNSVSSKFCSKKDAEEPTKTA